MEHKDVEHKDVEHEEKAQHQEEMSFRPFVLFPREGTVLDVTDISWIARPQPHKFVPIMKSTSNGVGVALNKDEYEALLGYMHAYGLLVKLESRRAESEDGERPKIEVASS